MSDIAVAMVRIVLPLFPLMLTVWGWAEWVGEPVPRSQHPQRQYIVAAGLFAALNLIAVLYWLDPRSAECTSGLLGQLCGRNGLG